MMTVLPFKDGILTRAFEQDGYVVVRNRPSTQLSALAEQIRSLQLPLGGGIYYSLMANSYAKNREIAQQVSAAMEETLAALFDGCRAYNPSFLVKPAQLHQEFTLHQDWCFTDTDLFRMGTVWMPLCDVDESNGCLTVVPRSHRAFRTFISGNLQTARIPMAALPPEAVKSVPMRMGDVLVFNPLVFHGSFANTTAEARAVATANVLPPGAPFCYHIRTGISSMERVQLHDDAVLAGLPDLVAGVMPTDAPSVTVPYQHMIPTAASLTQRLTEI